MSFSPSIFQKKLDSLLDTQDSIVSISQWVLFHHRHAGELCTLWAEYTMQHDSGKKRLSLLYLCNDVVQQARHKRKPEFASGFATQLPQVLHAVYASLDPGIKPKIDRLIGVWEQRSIFSAPQIAGMRRAVTLLGEGKALGDAPPAPEPKAVGIAPELANINTLYKRMTQLVDKSLANLSQVGIQSKQYLPNHPSTQDHLPLPKVYILKLNVLEKLCNMTTKNLEEARSTRQEILAALQSLQSALTDNLATEEVKLRKIAEKLEKLHSTRSELQAMEEGEEESSPAFELADTDDLVPTYEMSSDDNSDDETSAKPSARPEPERATPETRITNNGHLPAKRRLSDSSTSSRTSKKSVAFSEAVEVKEFDGDGDNGVIKIIRGETDSEDDYVPGFEPDVPLDLLLFSAHHKDDLELLHERQHDSDSYNPGDNDTDAKSGLLSLLSKLS